MKPINHLRGFCTNLGSWCSVFRSPIQWGLEIRMLESEHQPNSERFDILILNGYNLERSKTSFEIAIPIPILIAISKLDQTNGG